MKRLSIFAIIACGICLSFSLRAADEKKMTIVDYYLLLPDKTFETPARDWLNNATVIDKQNGYMSITGDGAQPSFEVALFRYRDGRPLPAICEGELEGDDSVTLNFYELGKDGKMRTAPREIFPIGDAWSRGRRRPSTAKLVFRIAATRSHRIGAQFKNEKDSAQSDLGWRTIH